VLVYLKPDLERFLQVVDEGLTQPAKVTVIGGAAAVLQFDVQNATRDIDTWTIVQADLAAAAAKARDVTGLNVPIE
jgi:hypothetical protein